MKRLILLALICFVLPASALASDYILGDVYGALPKAACYVDSDADLFATTVDQDSALGQKRLYVAATTDVVAGDVLSLNFGGAREEGCIVTAVAANDYVDCVANLIYTHTAAQADAVVLSNRIPATGTAGLSVGPLYVIQCQNSSGVGVACNCGSGGAGVSGTDGFTLYANSSQATYFKSGRGFVSCVPYADNAIIRVCPFNQ